MKLLVSQFGSAATKAVIQGNRRHGLRVLTVRHYWGESVEVLPMQCGEYAEMTGQADAQIKSP
jgi:hypothetical protein